MDFALPPDDDPRRLEVRAWLAVHPNPSDRQLHDAGYVVPHWPEPYGIDADPIHQLIIHEELRAAKVSGPANPIGIGWAAPTIMLAGTEEQKQRWLPKMASGELVAGVCMSEPGTGSDLHAVATTAIRDGDEYILNGQKTFVTNGQSAELLVVVCKTDPSLGGRGISLLVVETEEVEGFNLGGKGARLLQDKKLFDFENYPDCLLYTSDAADE